MIIYQAQYKYFHQIEPTNEILGYYQSKDSAIKVLSEKYKLEGMAYIVLSNDHYYSKGNSKYLINEIVVQD